jgi:hypothetical protein
MNAENFDELLGDLGLPQMPEEGQPGEMHFKLSAGVGLTMLGLGPQKKAAPAQRTPQYEELAEGPQAKPQFSIEDLAAEVCKAATAADLHRLRRKFARLFHPDRRGGAADAAATSEMAAVNRTIDEAIVKLRRMAPAKF